MWLYWLETIHSSLLVELLPTVFALNLLQCPHFICDSWRCKNCFESLFPSSFPPISVLHALLAGIAHTKRCFPMPFQTFLSSERLMANYSFMSNFIAFSLLPVESLRGSKMLDVCIVCLVKSFTKGGSVSGSP